MKPLPPGQQAKLAARQHATAKQRNLLRQHAERTEAETRGLEARYRAGDAVAQPSRITAALDTRGLYGPEVDTACLTAEPAVDEWEAGKAAPTWEQLVALANLTGFPVKFFTLEPLELAGGIMCIRSGPGKGCHPFDAVDAVEPYMPETTR